MLRLKKGTDLAVLESFGFKKDKIYGYSYPYKNSDKLIKSNNFTLKPYEDINHIVLVDNELYIHCNTFLPGIPDVIYDLFKAGLLEKENDNGEDIQI